MLVVQYEQHWGFRHLHGTTNTLSIDKHSRDGRTVKTHQICDNSKIGSLDLVKNSFAAEPKNTTTQTVKTIHSSRFIRVCLCIFPTRYEAAEVWLNGFELVNVILPLLVCDLPRIIVAAGLPLDLVGHRGRGHRSYRCAFLRETRRDVYI